MSILGWVRAARAGARGTSAAADLAAAIADHRLALDAYVATATRCDETIWNRAPSEEKWSPAQITEHLRLSYTTVHAELAGGTGFRERTSRWQQLMLRWTVLPRILTKGQMPRNVPAVREIRPDRGPYPQRELIESLAKDGVAFLAELEKAHGSARGSILHPFLGKLTLREGLGLLTSHLRHHHKQLERLSPP